MLRLKWLCDETLAAGTTQAHEQQQQQQHSQSLPAQHHRPAITMLPPTGNGEGELQLHALTDAVLEQPLQQEHVPMEYHHHHHPNQQHSGRWLFMLSCMPTHYTTNAKCATSNRVCRVSPAGGSLKMFLMLHRFVLQLGSSCSSLYISHVVGAASLMSALPKRVSFGGRVLRGHILHLCFEILSKVTKCLSTRAAGTGAHPIAGIGPGGPGTNRPASGPGRAQVGWSD